MRIEHASGRGRTMLMNMAVQHYPAMVPRSGVKDRTEIASCWMPEHKRWPMCSGANSLNWGICRWPGRSTSQVGTLCRRPAQIMPSSHRLGLIVDHSPPPG